jgi:hypothetical protein
MGFRCRVGVVPIVSGACIFDLPVGNPGVAPIGHGLAACNAAKRGANPPWGMSVPDRGQRGEIPRPRRSHEGRLRVGECRCR